jgi:hypothetical protein
MFEIHRKHFAIGMSAKKRSAALGGEVQVGFRLIDVPASTLLCAATENASTG